MRILSLLLLVLFVGDVYAQSDRSFGGLVDKNTGVAVDAAAQFPMLLDESPIIEKTIGSGGDFATIDEAFAWVNTKQKSWLGIYPNTIFGYEPLIKLTLLPGSYTLTGPKVIQDVSLELSAQTRGDATIDFACDVNGYGLSIAAGSYFIARNLTITSSTCTQTLFHTDASSMLITDSDLTNTASGFASGIFAFGHRVRVFDSTITAAVPFYALSTKIAMGGTLELTATLAYALSLNGLSEANISVPSGNTITLSAASGWYAMTARNNSEVSLIAAGSGAFVFEGAGGGISVDGVASVAFPSSATTFNQLESDFSYPVNEVNPAGGYIVDSDGAGITLAANRVPVIDAFANFSCATDDTQACFNGIDSAFAGLGGTAPDIDQWDISARISAGTGPYAGVAPSNLSTELTPEAGDYLLGWLASGELVKYDIDDLPGGAGGGASQLSDLTDVNTSTPTNRNFLIADGVDFESRAATVADISDLDNDAATLSLPASTTISSFGASLVDDATATAARTTLGVDPAGTDNSTDVSLTAGANSNLLSLSGQILGLDTQAQNSVFAGPTSGTGVPTFRSLVVADIPDLSGTYLTSEINSLEADGAVGILDDEVFVGSGGGTGAYLALPDCGSSGDKLLYTASTNTWSCGIDAGAGGGMTGFTVAGDSGGGQSITDGNTLTLAGGTALTTVDSATDTVTFNVDVATLEPLLSLQSLGGAVTDAQVPDSITISLAASATALAENGNNCIAGNAPLGIDASGAVEGCFDVWTEAENTAAGYLQAGSVDSDITTFALPASTTISAFGATVVDDADAATARETLGVRDVIWAAVSDETTDLTTGTAELTLYMPDAFTIDTSIEDGVGCSANTAPTGSVISVGINETGVSILGTDITIDATENTSKTAVTAPVVSDTALASGSAITFDIDGVGSTTAGKGLKCWIIGAWQ